MKTAKYIVLALALLALLATGCMNMKPVTEFSTDDAVFALRNGTIEVKATKDLSGLEVFLRADISEEAVNSKGTFTIVKPYEDGSIIATAIGDGAFEKGETVMTINGVVNDIKELGITTEGVYLETNEFEAQTQIPVNGVYVQDTWVLPEGSGSFVIGARNIGDGKEIAGFALDLAFNTADIEITSIDPVHDFVKEIEMYEFDNSEGTIKIDFAFKRGEETPIGNEPVNLYKVYFEAKTGAEPANSEVSFTDSTFLWLDPEQDWQPVEIIADSSSGFITIGDIKLLGDFDVNGTVEVDDLTMFTPHYRTATGDTEYDEYFDIAPAKKTYGGVWANIFTEANPDGEINILDLVILAQNWAFTRPSGYENVFVKTLDELNEAIKGNMNPIVLGADIDGSAGIETVDRIVDINLNGYTLTGDLNYDTTDTGTIELFAGTLDGNLTVNAPNATFNNFAEVTGTVTINGVEYGTWHEYACGNVLVWNATGKTLHVHCGSEGITFNEPVDEVTFDGPATVTGGGNIGTAYINSSGVVFDELPENIIVGEDIKVINLNKGLVYETIQPAIDEATAGDTIEVMTGTYDGFKVNLENLTIKTSENALINPVTGLGDAQPLGINILTGTTGLVVDGFIIDGNSVQGRGILSTYNTEYTLKNSTIRNFDASNSTGIYANAAYGNGTATLTVIDNTFNNCLTGIGGTENTFLKDVSGNTFTDSRRGISLGGGATGAENITNNDFENSESYVKDYRTPVELETILENNTFDPAGVIYKNLIVPIDSVNVVNVTQSKGYDGIQEAIDDANAGDYIEVNAGTYVENININKDNLYLKAVGEAIIEDVENPEAWSGPGGANMPDRMPVVFITADGAEIEGFKIRNYEPKDYVFSVVRVEADNVTVDNLDLDTDNYPQGSSPSYEEIVVAKGTGITITGNTINREPLPDSTGYGAIKLEREMPADSGNIVGDVVIENNDITGGPIAIQLQSGATVQVKNNSVDSALHEGIWVVPKDDTGALVFEGNTVTNYDRAEVGVKALKVTSKPASINGETGSYEMLQAILDDNPGIDTVELSWITGPVINVTQDTFYDTIANAIAAADANDTIAVLAGEYSEANISINKSLTLLGANAGISAAAGTGTPPESRRPETVMTSGGPLVFRPAADNIAIDGFKFTGGGGNLIRSYADSDYLTITNCVFDIPSGAGDGGVIQLDTGSRSNLTITNNRFDGIGTSSWLYLGGINYSNLIIEDNDFVGTARGIFQTGSGFLNTTIKNNYFGSEITTGINMGNLDNPTIENNLFDGVIYAAMQIGTVNGGYIKNNIVDGKNEPGYYFDGYGTLKYGIQIWGGAWETQSCEGLTISGNTVKNYYYETAGSEDWYVGIYLPADAGPDVTITGNTVQDNHYGMRFNTDKTGIDVNNNTFTDNVIQLIDQKETLNLNDVLTNKNNSFTPDSVIYDNMIVPNDYVNVVNVTQSMGYDTIQEAVNEATAGDTIEVATGTYDGFRINDIDDLTIEAIGDATVVPVVISGEYAGIYLDPGTTGLVVDSLAFDGDGIEGFTRGVLGTIDTEYTVTNCTFENVSTGIYANGSGNATAELTATGNTFTSCTAGIGGTENTLLHEIETNTFDTCTEGIGLGGGVSCDATTDPLVDYLTNNNTFTNCDTDVADYRP